MEHLRMNLESADLHLAVEGNGPPAILLHGAGQTLSGAVWRETMPLLSKRYRAYALDWPGRGWSMRKDSALSESDYHLVAAEAMRRLAPEERWLVVGQSFGGGMALRLAVHEPELVDRLVLVAPPPPARLGIDVSGISVPTTIVWGREDDVIPVSNAEPLHAQIRGSSLHIVENAKHWPHLEQPQAFQRIVAVELGLG